MHILFGLQDSVKTRIDGDWNVLDDWLDSVCMAKGQDIMCSWGIMVWKWGQDTVVNGEQCV